jgi:hypothetical protein
MAVITIPFDYDPQRDGGSVVPIYLNDTDDNGETIFFGWIEAVIPVQDKLRAVSRRVLGDVWRVSELTELTIHHLWQKYRENVGCNPSFRVIATAKRTAHSLEDPGARVHLALNISLDTIEEYRDYALIREMPISQRTLPQTGSVTGRAVAKDDAHIAVATAANSFFVVPSTSLGRDVEIGERLSLRFQRGLPSLEDDRTRAR